MSDEIVIKISKPGIDLRLATRKDMAFSIEYDTLKIYQTGEMSIDLPAEILTAEGVIRETTLAHGLSYVPICYPMVGGMAYTGNLQTGGDYNINDLSEIDIPGGPYGPFDGPFEASTFFWDDEVIGLRITRGVLIGSQIYGARNVKLFYTILYNRLDEELNLLN